MHAGSKGHQDTPLAASRRRGCTHKTGDLRRPSAVKLAEQVQCTVRLILLHTCHCIANCRHTARWPAALGEQSRSRPAANAKAAASTRGTLLTSAREGLTCAPLFGPAFLTWRMTQGSPWPAHSGGCMRCWMLRQAAAASARPTAPAWPGSHLGLRPGLSPGPAPLAPRAPAAAPVDACEPPGDACKQPSGALPPLCSARTAAPALSAERLSGPAAPAAMGPACTAAAPLAESPVSGAAGGACFGAARNARMLRWPPAAPGMPLRLPAPDAPEQGFCPCNKGFCPFSGALEPGRCASAGRPRPPAPADSAKSAARVWESVAPAALIAARSSGCKLCRAHAGASGSAVETALAPALLQGRALAAAAPAASHERSVPWVPDAQAQP